MTNKDLIIRLLNMCKSDLANSAYANCDSNLTVLLSLVDKMDIQEQQVVADIPNIIITSGSGE